MTALALRRSSALITIRSRANRKLDTDGALWTTLERAPIRSVDYRDYQDLGPWLLGWAAVALAFHALSASTWAMRLP